MLINIYANGLHMPLLAPLGAAAYAVKLDNTNTKLSIIFALIQPKEDGLRAITRVLKDNPKIDWKPVSAQPIEQVHFKQDAKDPYVSFDFKFEDDRWIPDGPTADFISAVSRVAALPAIAPKGSGVDANKWSAA